MESVLNEFEQACTNLQHNSQDIRNVGETYLRNLSAQANASEAARILQVVVIRDWMKFSLDQKAQIKSYLLDMSTKQLESGGNMVVVRQLMNAAASIMKHLYLELTPTQREFEFQTALAKSTFAPSNTPHLQITYLYYLQSLVDSFSAHSGSFPWESHLDVKSDFQKVHLRTFFQVGIQIGQECEQERDSSYMVVILERCLDLLSSVLGWDFSRTFRMLPRKISAGVAAERMSVQPGVQFQRLLFGTGLEEWVGRIVTADGVPESILQRALQLFVQLCWLQGGVFPRESAGAEREQVRDLHFRNMGKIIGCLCVPVEEKMKVASEEEGQRVNEVCQGFLGLAQVFKAEYLQDVIVERPQPMSLLQVMASVTQKLIDMGGVQEDCPDAWVQDSFHLCIDAFLAFFSATDASSHDWASATLVPLFVSLVESSLREFASGAMDEDDTEEVLGGGKRREEFAANVAALGRNCCLQSFPYLCSKMEQNYALICKGLKQVNEQQILVGLELQWWLQRMAALVLADSDESEVPNVPDQFQGSENKQQVVLQLSTQLLTIMDWVFTQQVHTSPRMMESLVWALGRWAATYLFQKDPWLNNFNSFGQGNLIVDGLVRLGAHCLLNMHGEYQLHKLVCKRLFGALIQNKVVSKLMLTLDSWKNLTNLFLSDKLHNLNPGIHKRLGKILIVMVSRTDDSDLITNYIKSMTEQKREILTRDVNSAIYMLQWLRGMCKGCDLRTQTVIFDEISPQLGQIVSLLQQWGPDNPQLVQTVFAFASNFVKSQISFLESAEALILMSWAIGLIEVYQQKISINQQIINYQIANGRSREVEREWHQQTMISMVELLMEISNRDIVDFSEYSNNNNNQSIYVNSNQNQNSGHVVGGTILTGLETLIPMICEQMFVENFSLSKIFFEFILYLIQTHPQQLLRQLNKENFDKLMQLLQFGIRCDEQSTCLHATEAVEALAQHQLQYKQFSQEQISYLVRFMDVLLTRALFEDVGQDDLLEIQAEALIFLISCCNENFVQIGQQIIQGCKDEGDRLRVQSAFQELAGKGLQNVNAKIGRNEKKKFSQLFCVFVMNVRGLVKQS